VTPRLAAALVLFSALGAACTGVITDPFGNPDPSSGGTGPGGGEGGGTGSSSAPIDCSDPDQPGPRMLRLLTREEYAATVADLLSIERPPVDEIPVEPRVAGYDNNAGASIVTSRHVDAYIALGEKLALSARATLASCDLTTSSCRSTFIERFGRRAFRRPLRAEERARFEAMFANDLSPTAADGVSLVVTSMLVSPSFLYRSELGERQSDGTYALTPFEVATALSYTFLGKGPDDRLLDVAASGSIDAEKEARTLLADSRSRSQVASFFTQWLDTTPLLSVNKDKTIYPLFTDSVREGLAAEQAAFVNQASTFGELLTADYVFANDAVAQFYGLPGGLGTTFKKIPAGPNRGGILALGSVLASHAHANESSPIKRGKFVRDRILCQELPPPPADADTTPPGLDPTLTTRERFAKHTADAACRSCHQFIDGVGFSFERYDGVGGYRELENGKTIDASGEIKGREGLDTGTSETFSGPKELAALLAKGESAPRCFATQWFRYSRGLREQGQEICTARALGSRFLEKGQSIPELLVSVVTQRSFLSRR
jgi:hypothetical protein